MTFIAKILCLEALLVVAGAASAADQMLAERHASRGVSCPACHATMPPKADVKSEACETCHGDLAKVATLTNKGDINPHASHVEEAKCLECHKGHKKPQLLCDQCHEFDNIRVP